MNAKNYIQKYGREKSEAMTKAAGTNFAYFSQIANGHRRPSFQLAGRLVEASGGELDLIELMSSKKAA